MLSAASCVMTVQSMKWYCCFSLFRACVLVKLTVIFVLKYNSVKKNVSLHEIKNEIFTVKFIALFQPSFRPHILLATRQTINTDSTGHLIVFLYTCTCSICRGPHYSYLFVLSYIYLLCILYFFFLVRFSMLFIVPWLD